MKILCGESVFDHPFIIMRRRQQYVVCTLTEYCFTSMSQLENPNQIILSVLAVTWWPRRVRAGPGGTAGQPPPRPWPLSCRRRGRGRAGRRTARPPRPCTAARTLSPRSRWSGAPIRDEHAVTWPALHQSQLTWVLQTSSARGVQVWVTRMSFEVTQLGAGTCVDM